MANLNRIILVGKVSDDPELRYTVEGLPIAKFTMAVDRFRGADKPKETDIINVVAWRKLAEVCGQYLKKGRLALIEGRIQVRTYQTDAGVKKWATEVVARNMQMLDAPVKGQVAFTGDEEVDAVHEAADDVPGKSTIPDEPGDDSDLPF